MPNEVYPPQYLRIALTIATRIANGEIKEGTKIYGRSVMASEFGVSPETIRRSMKLLADMNVVEIARSSGVYVTSRENAKQYIHRFGHDADMYTLRQQLAEMIAKHRELGKQIADTAAAISRFGQRALETEQIKSYEVAVPPGAHIAGKSLEELQFWQSTGATIVAIRRKGETILSPGPYAQLLAGDVIVVVGDLNAFAAAERYITEPAHTENQV